MKQLKMRQARKMLAKIPGVEIRRGRSGHDKISHPALSETFPLPIHGSGGSHEFSPGVTKNFLKFYAKLETVC